MIKKSESLKKKGGRAGKQRQLGEMEWIPLRKLRIDLADVEMIESLEEKHAGWKELG